VGSPKLAPPDSFDTRSYFVRFTFDRLDNVNFRAGPAGHDRVRGDTRHSLPDPLRRTPNTRQSYDRLSFSYWPRVRLAATQPCSHGRRNDHQRSERSVLSCEVTGPGGSRSPPRRPCGCCFSLGAFANLSGLKANSIAGPHFAIRANAVLQADWTRWAQATWTSRLTSRLGGGGGMCGSGGADVVRQPASRCQRVPWARYPAGSVYVASGLMIRGSTRFTCSWEGRFSGCAVRLAYDPRAPP